MARGSLVGRLKYEWDGIALRWRKTDMKRYFFTIAVVVLLQFTPIAGASAHTDLTPVEAKTLMETNRNMIVLDVREVSEFCASTRRIPCSVNYPFNSGDLEERLDELPLDADILVICQSGGRSNMAANFLDANGFTSVYDMVGGMSAWQWDTEPCTNVCPEPIINANGADGSLELDENGNLLVTIDLDPGSHAGENADMWVAVHTSAGWFHFDLDANSWSANQPLVHQAALSTFTSKTILKVAGLPPGVYTFYFVLDMAMDGQFTMDSLHYDAVEVNIQKNK